MKIWTCKIGEADAARLPDGADFPMRQAVRERYLELTGENPKFIFSGWGGALDDCERAVVEKRAPSEEYLLEKRKQDAAPDLYEALRGLLAMAEDLAETFPIKATDDGLTVIDAARAALAKVSPHASPNVVDAEVKRDA